MRISAISDWTACEAMALTDPRPEARVHVAAWVGTLAHALLTGSDWPEGPTRVRFDATTPTEHAVKVQAESLAASARRCLEIEGWAVMETEREVTGNGDTGHLDILAWHGETERSAIIDLKTGQRIGAGWLQVGGYLALLRGDRAFGLPSQYRTDLANGASDLLDGMCGGILHVPRVAVSKEPKATLELRDGRSLTAAWATAKSRIDTVLAGATALRSPGQHCGRCSANCPVRI